MRYPLLTLACCLIAGLRVFIFSAALPFFNPIDEPEHFDMVLKYASGKIPRRMQTLEPQTVQAVSRFGSWEFMRTAAYFNGTPPQPVWTLPQGKREAALKARGASFQGMANRYSTQPPGYYALAGGWMRLGSALGLTEGRLLYWIRFMNIIPAVLTVILGALLAWSVFPKDRAVGLGTPMLLAVFPQDVQYAVNSDTLSAVLMGGTFLLLASPRLKESPVSTGLLAGLLGLLAALSKQSNIPILAGMIIAALLLAVKSRNRAARKTLYAIILAAAIAGMGIAGWSAKSLFDSGDPTGMQAKWQASGWSLKPLPQIPFHPIFSVSGAWFFADKLARTFWRGDTVWHGPFLAAPDADLFYVATSLLFLAVLLFSSWSRRKTAVPGREQAVLQIGAGGLAGGILFLAAVSVLFDFGNSVYPSAELPYLFSGRLISGAIIPFVLLYLSGLGATIGLLPRKLRAGIDPAWCTAIICLYIMLSEIRISPGVFSSGYNWFHLP